MKETIHSSHFSVKNETCVIKNSHSFFSQYFQQGRPLNHVILMVILTEKSKIKSIARRVMSSHILGVWIPDYTEQECMNAGHDTLRAKAEDGSLLPVMWSLYHAARSDVVGQCRQSIEALLAMFYEKAATSDMIRLGLELVRMTTECLHLQKSHYLS